MQHYSSQAFTDIGKPAAGATITIKLAGSNTNATIYSDDGITVKSNPFATNNLGQFDFYAASGKYDITVTGTQITTYTLPNQVVFDPFESNAADMPFVSMSLLPLNIAGQGGFFGVTLSPPQNTAFVQSAMVSAANEVWVVQFTLPFRVQIGKLTVRVETGVISTTGDVGIYDVNGNRLVYTGGFSTLSTGNLSLPVVNAPITLNAGFYYLAQTNTSATPTLDAVIIEVGSWDIFTDGGTVGNNKVFGKAANPASSGVLPATLGAITNSIVVNAYPKVYFGR